MMFYGLSFINICVLYVIDVFLLVKWFVVFCVMNGFCWFGSIVGEIFVLGFFFWKLNFSGNKIDEINIFLIKIRNLLIVFWIGVMSSSWMCCG